MRGNRRCIGRFLDILPTPHRRAFFGVHIPNKGMARAYDDAMDSVISCSKGNFLSRVAKLDGLRTYTISTRSAADSAPTPALCTYGDGDADFTEGSSISPPTYQMCQMPRGSLHLQSEEMYCSNQHRPRRWYASYQAMRRQNVPSLLRRKLLFRFGTWRKVEYG